MVYSKSRSGSFDLAPEKSHSSIFSRTVSSSRFCRGNSLLSQIDTEALVCFGRKAPKVSNSSQNRSVGYLRMQQEVGQQEERTKEQFVVAMEGRERALKEVREMKEELLNSKKALEAKDKNIDSLKAELQQAKQFERKLVETDALLEGLKENLSNAKASEAKTLDLLSDTKKRILALEVEIEGLKKSESNVLDSFSAQTKLLEHTKIQLEESKIENVALHEKLEKMGILSRQSSRDLEGCHGNENEDLTRESFGNLRSELQLAKENLARAQEGEKFASLRAHRFAEEVESLRNDLKLAVESEEKSTKAMDDLALALKEVATRANQANERLQSKEVELDHIKGESEQLKSMVRITEERYKKLLDEEKKESELHRNTANRLRVEAEEAFMAWNGKEMGFVSCIKRAEDEKAVASRENARLAESLKASETATRTAKEENHKLRDILKQALNEANVAKEATGIAREENSQLKDSLADKEEAMHFLAGENERLRISEAAAQENAKELKRLLSAASADLKMEEKNHKGNAKSPSLMIEREAIDALKKGFSFDLNELKFLNEHEQYEMAVEEDPVKAETLKGSIFDTTVASPKSEPKTPKPVIHHRRGSSFVFNEEEETPNSEEIDHLDDHHSDEAEKEINHRRRKALLRRFGDLIMKKSFHRKEPSTDKVAE